MGLAGIAHSSLRLATVAAIATVATDARQCIVKPLAKPAFSAAALHAWIGIQRRERFFVSIDFYSLGCPGTIFSGATCFATTGFARCGM
jgi:hypothetical protein